MLFTAAELGFFDDEATGGEIPAWTETIKAQRLWDRDEQAWSSPLRYALVLLMINHGKQESDDDKIATSIRQTILDSIFRTVYFPMNWIFSANSQYESLNKETTKSDIKS
jgi:hypothetical protein